MYLHYSSTQKPQGAIVFGNVKSKRQFSGGIKHSETGHNKLVHEAVAQTWKKKNKTEGKEAALTKLKRKPTINRRNCKGR